MIELRLNLVGECFGRLKVVEELPRRVRPSGQRARYFLCRCQCGKTTERSLGDLRSGHSVSCGCSRTEKTVERNTKHGLSRQHPAEYVAWKGMRARCNNPNHQDYHRYGGRGIAVSEWWAQFDHFFADMGPKPSPKHSVDRWPDRDGDYGPGNCRWASPLEQSKNRDVVTSIVLDGREVLLADLSRATGVRLETLRNRLHSGWSPERIASPHVRGGRRTK